MDDVLKELEKSGIKHGKAFLMDAAVLAVPLALEELKKVIPGQIDDAIIEGIKPTVVEALKAQIEKLGA